MLVKIVWVIFKYISHRFSDKYLDTIKYVYNSDRNLRLPNVSGDINIVHYLCCQASLCESPWYLYIVCPLTPSFRTQWLCFHLKFIIILLARTRHLFIMVFIDKFWKFIWIKFDQVELIIYVCLLTQVKAPGVCFSDH